MSAGLVLSLEIDQFGDADVVKIDRMQQIYGRDGKDVNHLSGSETQCMWISSMFGSWEVLIAAISIIDGGERKPKWVILSECF